MDIFFDENIAPRIAIALNALEGEKSTFNVFSTEQEIEKGIKDVQLIVKIKERNGVLVTHDLKMRTRRNEIDLIRSEGITVFFLSLPSNAKFEVIYQYIFRNWEKIKSACLNNKHPFICRINSNGKTEID